jgi:hypothetical protein
MGFDEPFFRRGDEEMIRDALDWNSPAVDGITIAGLRQKGYTRLNVGSPERRIPHANGEFLTPSGKCEFKSSLAVKGSFVLPNFRQGYKVDQAGTPVEGVPDGAAALDFEPQVPSQERMSKPFSHDPVFLMRT